METRVAKIISETTVVLAAGSDHGVRRGTKFVIYDPGPVIQDPETGEPLGNLEIVKGRVQATHVMPSMCVAKTAVTTTTRHSVFGPTGDIARFLGTTTVELAERLKVNPEDCDEAYGNPDTTVRVGDLARSMED